MATEQRRTEELRNYAGLIWSIADSLRGPYKRSEYGHVILPLTLMRRLDQAMEDFKDAVVAEAERRRVCPIFCVWSGVTDRPVGAGKDIHDRHRWRRTV